MSAIRYCIKTGGDYQMQMLVAESESELSIMLLQRSVRCLYVIRMSSVEAWKRVDMTIDG